MYNVEKFKDISVELFSSDGTMFPRQPAYCRRRSTHYKSVQCLSDDDFFDLSSSAST